jgi:hypothetical protein
VQSKKKMSHNDKQLNLTAFLQHFLSGQITHLILHVQQKKSGEHGLIITPKGPMESWVIVFPSNQNDQQ